jgi:hypothetical protein
VTRTLVCRHHSGIHIAIYEHSTAIEFASSPVCQQHLDQHGISIHADSCGRSLVTLGTRMTTDVEIISFRLHSDTICSPFSASTPPNPKHCAKSIARATVKCNHNICTPLPIAHHCNVLHLTPLLTLQATTQLLGKTKRRPSR